MKRVFQCLAALVIISLMAGCTVTQQIHVKDAKTGSASFDFDVEEFFVDVLEDFSDFVPEPDNRPLMDKAIDDFERALFASRATADVQLIKVGEQAWRGTFRFFDLMQLLIDLGSGPDQTLLTLSDTSMTFYLSLENYEQLVPVIPFLADPNFEAFGPLYNEGLSEEDYLEMIGFMLGEEGIPAINNSAITLRIETPRPITSHSGGHVLGDRLYEFSFPLIDFLLLAKPITFSVTW